MLKQIFFVVIASLLLIINLRGKDNNKYYSSHIGIKVSKAMDIEKGDSISGNKNYDVNRYHNSILFFYNYLSQKGGMFEMELGIKTGMGGYYYWSYNTGNEYTYGAFDIQNSMISFDIAGGFKIISAGFKFLFRGTPTFKNQETGDEIKDEDFSETDVIFYLGVGGLINLNITENNRYGLALKLKVGYPLTAGYSEIIGTTWSGYYAEVEAGVGIGI